MNVAMFALIHLCVSINNKVGVPLHSQASHPTIPILAVKCALTEDWWQLWGGEGSRKSFRGVACSLPQSALSPFSVLPRTKRINELLTSQDYLKHFIGWN